MGVQHGLFGNGGGKTGKGYPVHEGCGGALLPVELTRQDLGTPLACAKCHRGVTGSRAQVEQADRAAEAEGFDLEAARRNKRLTLHVQAGPAKKPVQRGLFGSALDAPAALAPKRTAKKSPSGQGSLF